MNIKEMNLELEKLNDEYDIKKVHLNNDIIKLKHNLRKTIKKHFRGVEVTVYCTNTIFAVGINGNRELTYSYDNTEFSHLTKKLAYQMIKEYEEVYGEIEE